MPQRKEDEGGDEVMKCCNSDGVCVCLCVLGSVVIKYNILRTQISHIIRIRLPFRGKSQGVK